MQRYSEYKDSGVQWLGEIPSHWEVKRLRNFLTLFSEKGFGDSQLLSVTREKGVILRDKENKDENHNFVPDDLNGYKHLYAGDFVVNKMKSWQGSYGVSDYEGIVSPAYFTCKLKGVNPKFFSRAIRSKAYVAFFMQYSKGIRVDQWDLDPNSMKDIPFVLPNKKEQEAIVNYLDSVTSKIDIAIAQQQKMIDLLNERKQIIINNAVTKGLNPNVKMKDSGVEWIGEIPEHWEVIRIKHLLRESKIRSMRGKEEPLSMSQSYGLIPTKNMETIPNMASSYAGAKIVKKGNLVFNKLKAHLGVFNVSKYDGLVSPDYAVYSSLGKVNLRFLEYLFKTPKCIHEFVKLITGVGAGLSRLYTSDLFSIYCAIPSLEEQNSICSYIQNRTLKIDESIMLYRKQISLLQERKQIIINDVVTGKIKVV